MGKKGREAALFFTMSSNLRTFLFFVLKKTSNLYILNLELTAPKKFATRFFLWRDLQQINLQWKLTFFEEGWKKCDFCGLLKSQTCCSSAHYHMWLCILLGFKFSWSFMTIQAFLGNPWGKTVKIFKRTITKYLPFIVSL